ncbi:glycosyltransferase family 2 protein [Arenibacter sp. N53]|uniref:glycosyltransferase family 2 protein n=1 Tax=Arenibacter TaxID=178469 RepID=UPI000CD3B2C5|nr:MULTISPECIES: glycosyltransferase family 2 protein [Arenibacter]MCM4150243.1 glycosyltransferase family 2 protein [Arenibacter sp. N53]
MKISVCMATYNGERFLKEQIDSILHQISPDDELIISDDGSTDNTIEIISSYKDERIKLYHSTKGNLIYNFENALKQASGDIIFLSDQDDIWFHDKVEKSVWHLQGNGLVFSNALMFHDTEKVNGSLFFKNSKNKTGVLSNLLKVKYLGATLAFKSSILQKALPFPTKLPMHDVWIGLIAEITSSTYYIDEPLIYYRRHENTASRTGEKSTNSLFRMLKIRYGLIFNLCKRMATS